MTTDSSLEGDLYARFSSAALASATVGLDAACEASFGILWKIAKPIVAAFSECPADTRMRGLLRTWEKETESAGERALLARAVADEQGEVFSQLLRQLSHARAETTFEAKARRWSLKLQMHNAALLGSGFELLRQATNDAQIDEAMNVIAYRLPLLGGTPDEVKLIHRERMSGRGQEAYRFVKDIVSCRAHAYAVGPLHMGMAAAASSEKERDSYCRTIRETFETLGFPVGLVPLALEASSTLPDVEQFCERLAAAL